MLGLSGEHLILMTVVLLFFGPRWLPGAGATLGRAFRKFRETKSGILEPDFRRLRDRHDEDK